MLQYVQVPSGLNHYFLVIVYTDTHTDTHKDTHTYMSTLQLRFINGNYNHIVTDERWVGTIFVEQQTQDYMRHTFIMNKSIKRENRPEEDKYLLIWCFST